MLPDLARTTASATFRVAAAQWPVAERSGDLFEVTTFPDGSISIVLADVCGNGPTAAAIGARVRALVAARAPGLRRPGELLGVLGEVIERQLPLDRFVCALAIHLAGDGHLRLARAGHLGPYLLREGCAVACTGAAGPPLGIFAGVTYDEVDLHLAAGDVLVLATDGVSDRFATAADHTGSDGLCTRLGGLGRGENLCRRLLWAAAPLAADATVLTIERAA